MFLERRVVDQDVQLAECRNGLFHGLLAKVEALDVARNQEAAPALGLDVALGFFRIFVLVQVHDGHVGAFAREQHRDGPADAGVAAGDDGDFPVELAAALVRLGHEARALRHLRFDAGLGQVLVRHRRRRLRDAGLYRGVLLAIVGVRSSILLVLLGLEGLLPWRPRRLAWTWGPLDRL